MICHPSAGRLLNRPPNNKNFMSATRVGENSVQENMENLYFDFQADMGFTKHMGAQDATEQLIELTHIQADSSVLEVGCGVGITAIHLTEKIGCKVAAVDVREKMVAGAERKAGKLGLKGKIDFRTAEAENLPYHDKLFHAVICESVNTFVDDKQQAFDEYYRVLKSDGWLVINEATWLKEPTEEVRRYVTRFITQGDFPPEKEWRKYLQNAGFENISSHVKQTNIKEEALSRIRRYGLGTLLRIWFRAIKLYFTRKEYRKFIKAAFGATSGGIGEFISYTGYGLYSGQKLDS